MLESLRGYVPIRKIVTVLVTGGLSWLALRSGLDLGNAAVNQATPLIVGALFGYVERDPKVAHVVSVLDPSDDKSVGKFGV